LNQSPNDPSDEAARLSFWQLLKSTSSAFIGVQSNANRERDFKHGKISPSTARYPQARQDIPLYLDGATILIWMGLLFGLVFVLTLVGVVQLVLHFTAN